MKEYRTKKRLKKGYRKTPNSNPYENYPRPRKNNSPFGKILALMILIFLGTLLGIVLLSTNRENIDKVLGQNTFLTKILDKISLGNGSKKSEFSFPFGPKRRNILLLGVDSNGADADLWVGTRTDTIILLNIDPRTKTVNALTIPRDSKVYLPNNMGTQKINAAHAIGGIKMTVKTIEDTLGVKIDRYIMLHDEGVRAIVDALGGVDIYVEKDMHYNDYSGKLHINLKQGQQKLTKDNVVEYLRFRHDALGDIGRTRRQQWFLRGLLSDLKKPETIVKIPGLISVANKYIKTDMSPYEMTQYATLARGFDMDNIEIAMLPGGPNQSGSISYWILDPDKTQQVVDRLIYRQRPNDGKESYSASIMSSPSRKQDAKELKTALESAGINVKCTGTVNSTHSQFIAHSKYVTVDYYALLKKQIPQVKSKQFVYEPSNYMCASTDFTIVLAGENQ